MHKHYNGTQTTKDREAAQFLLLTAYGTSYSPRKAQPGLRMGF
ncbi:MAG: hypothetical protein Q8O42_19055 [Acidobacteriota bacterium]|nr:hypothetical protein [Acidobacteriota bacterium]